MPIEDTYIECKECGSIFTCFEPWENRQWFEDHLPFCTHNKKKTDPRKLKYQEKKYGTGEQDELS